MTSTTINGTVTSPVVLGTGIYGSTLTISTGDLVQPTRAGESAVTGAEPGEAVLNYGTIAAIPGIASYSAGGDGISMYCEDAVLNTGLIEGGSSGFSDQSPYQGGSGIDFMGSGIVANSGTITGGSGGGSTYQAANGGFGVDFRGTGRVLNTGSILGGQAGVDAIGGGEGGIGLMLGKSAQVTNFGLVQAGSGAQVTHSGEETSSGPAMEFQSTGELLNSGTIGQQAMNSVGVLSVGSIDLDNLGRIFGLDLQGGGTVVNSGAILGENGSNSIQGLSSSGSAGISVNSASTLLNEGMISGGTGYSGANFGGAAGGAGVLLGDGEELLLNNASISGGLGSALSSGLGGTGVVVGKSDTVVNRGQIAGGEGFSGEGVELDRGLVINMGTIIGSNSVSASSSLSAGVYVDGGILVAQAGTIASGASGGQTPSHGLAVAFGNTASGTLVVSPSATFIGGIQASTHVADTLILSGHSSGTMSSFSSAGGINNFSKILETDGSHWNLTGTISDCSIGFEGSSWLGLTGATSRSTVDFAIKGEDQLHLTIPDHFSATIHDFSIDDSIFLDGKIGESLQYAQNKLFIFGSGGKVLAKLSFQGNYVVSDFALRTSADKTEISWSTAGSLTPNVHP